MQSVFLDEGPVVWDDLTLTVTVTLLSLALLLLAATLALNIATVASSRLVVLHIERFELFFAAVYHLTITSVFLVCKK